MINLSDKKRFLNWLVSHVAFSRREVSWILNYLATHETILNNVCFVEHANATPRGIKVQGTKADEQGITLFLEGKAFVDSDQIFHEIRLNWQKPLYLECDFSHNWSNELFLAVLQDNPYYRWNETLDGEMVARVNAYFSEEDLESQLLGLYKQIDLALEEGNQEHFLELSAAVNQLLEQKIVATK